MDVMVDVGIRELRDGLSRHLTSVKEGETITITEHGRPIARIVPAGPSKLDELISRGLATPARKPRGTLPPPLRIEGGPGLSEIVIEQRG